MPAKTKLTEAKRLALIAEVLTTAYQKTDSWREDFFGVELAYLAHAIAIDDGIDLSPSITDFDVANRCALTLLRDIFPPEHAVWQFIKTENDADQA